MIQSFRPVFNKPASGLIQVALNIWTIEAKGCICYRPPMQPRYPYTHRSIVIRLNDSSLFVLSPIQLTPEIRADIDRLGAVKYLVSPNHLHHLYLGDWSQAYADARLYASPLLPPKRKDLTFYKTLSTNIPEPEWAGQIDPCIFGSGNGWIDELVFFPPCVTYRNIYRFGDGLRPSNLFAPLACDYWVESNVSTHATRRAAWAYF